MRFSSALYNFEKHGFVQMIPKTMVQLKLCSGHNTILYVFAEIRTADELVHMIAHFYYNAKRPSWIDVTALS